MLPLRLYKYQAVSAPTLANLKSHAVWFSAPSRFNDPFDCALQIVRPGFSGSDVKGLVEQFLSRHPVTPELLATLFHDGEPTDVARDTMQRAVLDALDDQRESLLERRGVACFCECFDDLLMWSHYADGHRGLCLEFSTAGEPFSDAKQVHYDVDVPEISPVDILAPGPADHIRSAMLLTKARCWFYEREWRVFNAEANVPGYYDHRLLTGVYLGAAMPPDFRDLCAQLLLGTPTQLYLMERETTTFGVKPAAVEYAPFQYPPSNALARQPAV